MNKLQYSLFLALCMMLGLASYQIRTLSEKRAKVEIRIFAQDSVEEVRLHLPEVEAREQEVKLMEEWLRNDGECK